MSEFFAMGGYAVFVWPSYAIFTVILVWNALTPRGLRRRTIQQIQRNAALEQERKSHDTNS